MKELRQIQEYLEEQFRETIIITSVYNLKGQTYEKETRIIIWL